MKKIVIFAPLKEKKEKERKERKHSSYSNAEASGING